MQQSLEPPPTRSKIFDGLFLYPGALPLFPALAELARTNPRPLILFSLEEDELYLNVVEGERGDKERMRRKFWTGCVIQFYHKSQAPYSQILQETRIIAPLHSPSLSLSSSPTSPTTPSIRTAVLLKKLQSKIPLSSPTKLKIGSLRLADGILGKGKEKECGMKILKETDGVGVPFRMRVENRLWDLKVAFQRDEDGEEGD